MLKHLSKNGFATLLGILLVMIILPIIIIYYYFHSITPQLTVPNRDVQKIREDLENLPPQGVLDNAQEQLNGGVPTPTATPSPQPTNQTSNESVELSNPGKSNPNKPQGIEVMN